MAAAEKVGLQLLDRGERAARARDALAAALPGAQVDDADDTGVFEVTVDAPSHEEALQQVWDAIAAAGADDHIAFAEHPDLPEHWRHRARARP
jgi:hypothetical protein